MGSTTNFHSTTMSATAASTHDQTDAAITTASPPPLFLFFIARPRESQSVSGCQAAPV
jgi:hypothetical protein